MPLRLVLGLIGLGLLHAPAAAAPSRGLPEGWTMVDDAHYAPSDARWNYKPPAPRRGTYAHGASGELETAEGVDAEAQADACYRRNGHYPAAADAPDEEYWYFEAQGEALLLRKYNQLGGYDGECKAIIRSGYTIERGVIGKDSFTRFFQTPTGWSPTTRPFAEYRRDSIGDIGIGNGRSAMERFAVRKRRLDDSDRGGKIGRVETHCIYYSSPPDAGGGQCWIANGPGKGMVTSDYAIMMGSEFIYHNVTDLEDDVLLDGRLFEWDRAIRHGAADAAK